MPDEAPNILSREVHYFEGIRDLLRARGLDPSSPDLERTPYRAWKAMIEMTEGYEQDPAAILSTTFDVTHDEMVVVSGIDFVSLCEHHLLPFTGTAVVGYVPNGSVVGLSKIPRLVHCYARRFQVQERMTEQIADAMAEHLAPHAVGVVCKATHSCMSCRGVRASSASMTTSALRGSLRVDAQQRAEFLAHAR